MENVLSFLSVTEEKRKNNYFKLRKRYYCSAFYRKKSNGVESESEASDSH